MSNGNKFFGEKLYCKNEEVNILKISKEKLKKWRKILVISKLKLVGIKIEISDMKQDFGLKLDAIIFRTSSIIYVNN